MVPMVQCACCKKCQGLRSVVTSYSSDAQGWRPPPHASFPTGMMKPKDLLTPKQVGTTRRPSQHRDGCQAHPHLQGSMEKVRQELVGKEVLNRSCQAHPHLQGSMEKARQELVSKEVLNRSCQADPRLRRSRENERP
eukprot:1070552-Pelagomonas_calceolata.AAC.1